MQESIKIVKACGQWSRWALATISLHWKQALTTLLYSFRLSFILSNTLSFQRFLIFPQQRQAFLAAQYFSFTVSFHPTYYPVGLH